MIRELDALVLIDGSPQPSTKKKFSELSGTTERSHQKPTIARQSLSELLFVTLSLKASYWVPSEEVQG